jgi:hypothetical protein
MREEPASDLDLVLSSHDLVYQDGCKSKLINAFQTVIHVVCAILVTFSVFNFLSISLSLILARQLRIGYQYT